MYKMQRVMQLAGVSALILIFTLSGISHDLIKHEHGHSAQESAVWQQLHSAVRHDDKKTTPVPAFAAFTFLSYCALLFVPFVFAVDAFALEPARDRYLRRGVAPYRRFA